MKSLAQRAAEASGAVDGETAFSIGQGLLALVSAMAGDTGQESRMLATKIASHRFFGDEVGKMSRSVADVDGSVLVVSQFTVDTPVELV